MLAALRSSLLCDRPAAQPRAANPYMARRVPCCHIKANLPPAQPLRCWPLPPSSAPVAVMA